MMPDSNPPPPTGATITSNRVAIAESSCPSEALPAITSGSSYADATYASGSFDASSRTRSARDTWVVSTRSTVAPNARTASTLTRTEFAGMATVHRLPASLQAYAIAWPKLPDEAVMIDGLGTFTTTLFAALNLKLPVNWNVSAARVTFAQRRSERRGASINVVGRGVVRIFSKILHAVCSTTQPAGDRRHRAARARFDQRDLAAQQPALERAHGSEH